MATTPNYDLPIVDSSPEKAHDLLPQIRDFQLAVDAALFTVSTMFFVFDGDGALLGTATGLRGLDLTVDGSVAVIPTMPLVRSQAQIDAMSSPLPFVLYANSDTGKLQYFDGAQWVILGAGGGVIGIPPSATASWASDTGVTGSPVSAWESLDASVTLAQGTGSQRPAVTGSVFASTQGLTFDGSNDNLTVATQVIAATGEGTISIVFKTGASVAGPMVIVSQSDSAVTNNWVEIGINADGKLYIESNASGTKHTVIGSTVLDPSTVYDMQLAYDGTDYYMQLNSVEENPLVIENIGVFAWFGRVAGTTAFTVGGTITSGGLQRPFAGAIGAIYLWAVDLTGA